MSSSSAARQSPFRETEWDLRLNNLLDDLENSTSHVDRSKGGGTTSSTSSAAINTDAMLKDLNSALNASCNYIESSRTVTSGPASSSREYHEYRSYTSNNNNNNNNNNSGVVGGGLGGGGGGGANVIPDFNLEQQVQHMMPSSSLNSANLVSSMQQQKTSKTVTSYSSSSSKFIPDQERPGSRLKQNIDELDTLLYDLNNARKMSSDVDYTASSPGNVSSDDYHDHHHHQQPQQPTRQVKQTSNVVHSFSEFNEESRKPPSPSPRRRPVTTTTNLSSPSTVRKITTTVRSMDEPVSTYNNSSSTTTTTKHYYQQPQQQPQQHQQISIHTSVTRPVTPSSQQPPKRVDELMTELSEFDPSIHPSECVEPPQSAVVPLMTPPNKAPAYRQHDVVDEVDDYRRNEPMPNKAGPAVYYPPGEMFGTETAKLKEEAAAASAASSLHRSGDRGQKYAKRQERGKHSESEGKQGAAVVPICLPLCCAAPCVIL